MKALDQTIYLASKSPRRRELLRQIGVPFELLLLRDAAPRGPDVTELVLPGEDPAHYVARVTLEKVEFAARVREQRKLPVRPILAADTTVVIDGEILGKPADVAEATAMLNRLSGRSHQVLTSIALWHGHQSHPQSHPQCHQRTHVSQVEFDTLTPEAIAAYCASREPYDKAGAYGIQGPAAIFIRELRGSQSGIMGLPLFETAQLLRLAGLQLP
jgi:septum formation protein